MMAILLLNRMIERCKQFYTSHMGMHGNGSGTFPNGVTAVLWPCSEGRTGHAPCHQTPASGFVIRGGIPGIS